ncbi:MAG: ATP synthase subunit I [Pusillimonas sp.]
MSLANQVKSAGSETPVRLTEEQKAIVRARAVQGLVRALAAQGLMALVAAVLSWAVGGASAGFSALLGAAVYLVPNSFFALRLLISLLSGRGANPAGFLVGELIKLVAATGLLALLVYTAQSWLVWPALIFGLIMALKGYVLLLMFGKLT